MSKMVGFAQGKFISSLLLRKGPAANLSKQLSSKMSNLPKLLVFDLDGCLWVPEMYELLYGTGGAPFKTKSDGDLTDKSGNIIELMGNVREIMHELKTNEKWSNTRVAIASKCNEPNWAHECLDKFELPDKIKLRTVFHPDLIEIYFGNKQNHLKAIASKSNIDLKDMIFFDNQMDNCVDVAKIGVTVAYTPSGVTKEAFDQVLEAFPAPGKIIKGK